jgi:sugar O-acyltransferase (sialic acid O-acetyltransferase NeuD family)
MMKDIAIFGAGGMGRETACLINRLNKSGESWNFVGFFDDGLPIGQPVSHYGKVLGGIDALNAWPRDIALSIALGNPDLIFKIRNTITNPRVSFPNLIDPSFEIVDPMTFSIGEGNIIQQHCMVSCGTSIGNFNLLNGGVVLGHDASIGNYNSIMPGVRISGNVRIGDCNLFGVGSIVIQQIKIGNHVHLGAGSTLFRRPKDNMVYVGVPAQRLKF